MLTYPEIDPVLFSLGPLRVHWYGMMYVLGFIAAYLLVRYQASRFAWHELHARLDNLLLALMIGLVVGARLGFALIYHPTYYLHNPLEILYTWSGGMSFHGGCLGAVLAGWCYCRRSGLAFWPTADLFVTAAPVGLFFGRIGNFINAELYGRVSDVPWAMIFPDGGPLPRHPSQLYEALTEGLLLFIILWSLKGKAWRQPPLRNWPHGSMLCLFLIGYGLFRFIIEYFRQPDSHLGFVWLQFSMGQVLCALMIVAGALLWRLRIHQAATSQVSVTLAGGMHKKNRRRRR